MLAANNEAVTPNDSLELATWNRPRTSEELREFIVSHHDRLPSDISIE